MEIETALYEVINAFKQNSTDYAKFTLPDYFKDHLDVVKQWCKENKHHIKDMENYTIPGSFDRCTFIIIERGHYKTIQRGG